MSEPPNVCCTGCRRVWLETCPDCAAQTAQRHTTATGHQVRITPIVGLESWGVPSIGVLQAMTARAARHGW